MADAHALLIQISAYPTMRLPEVDDARDLAAVLSDPALGGYPKGQVKTLRDGEATKAAILAAVTSLVEAATPGSTVLLYFSGHGGRSGGTSYLFPIDVDTAAIPDSAISAEALVALLAPLRDKRVHDVLLVFDACHAGGMRARNLGSEWEPGLGADAQRALAGNWVLLAATGAEDLAVSDGVRHGVFTRHFLDGLRGEAANAEGEVKLFALFEHVRTQVAIETRQHPVLICEVLHDFVVSRAPGGPAVVDDHRYDALLVFSKADAPAVHAQIMPTLRNAGLRIATSGELTIGMSYVLDVERGLGLSRRAVVVLSEQFLASGRDADRLAEFGLSLRKFVDIIEGRFSIVPLYLQPQETLKGLSMWLRALKGVDVFDDTAPEELARLVRALRSDVPTR